MPQMIAVLLWPVLTLPAPCFHPTSLQDILLPVAANLVYSKLQVELIMVLLQPSSGSGKAMPTSPASFPTSLLPPGLLSLEGCCQKLSSTILSWHISPQRRHLQPQFPKQLPSPATYHFHLPDSFKSFLAAVCFLPSFFCTLNCLLPVFHLSM